MKKSIALIFLFIMTWSFGFSQNSWETWRNSVRQRLAEASTDTSRVLAMADMCNLHKNNRPDSALFYGYNALTLARQIKFPKGELEAMLYLAFTYLTLGNNAKALQISLQALKIAEKSNLIRYKADFLFVQGPIYTGSKNYEKGLAFLRESKKLFDSVHNDSSASMVQYSIGEAFIQMNQPDSALHYFQLANENKKKAEWVDYFINYGIGKAQHKKGNTELALAYFRQSLGMTKDKANLFDSNLSIAKLFQQTGNSDSSVYYAKKSLLIAQETNFYPKIIDANLFLSSIYEKEDTKKALQYNKTASAYKDSLKNLINATAKETFIEFDEKERQQEIEAANTEFKSRIRMNAFLGITFTLLVIAVFLFWNSRLKQKAKQNIEKAYDQLKSTQSQLIQSEKMASLGELTAGIAHEIQNPLNFVNNFSEVNKELITEMREEIAKKNFDEVNQIAKDIEENEDKIIHHGKRADAIVKGMLQHSRSSSGVKELTDINTLADEYLRLAYHGLRAKDKSFNATMKTDFDESIGNINIIPQDIGRVILNLITNAFYAVNEKKKQNPEGYEPTVSVTTKRTIGKVEMLVKDNGNGIPPNIMDKIFQPFFTTKPTGEGTGLGLSLAYDIVKAHGGELKVETKAGEGSEFIIQIPTD